MRCKYCNITSGTELKVECLDKCMTVRISCERKLIIETTADDVWGNVEIKYCPMCGRSLMDE